jgi:hypothetical protein
MVEEPGEVPQLPVPPPFMWECPQCTRLLRQLDRAWDNPEGCFWEQLTVARHVAKEHPEDVPAPHLDHCELCPEYARRQDDDLTDVWVQHRARDLFMPSSIARLF